MMVNGTVAVPKASFGLSAIMVCFLIAVSACDEKQPEPVERVRAIKTITVSERGSGQVRRFPGIVQATDTSTLSFEVSGNTRAVSVKAGDRIKEGQVLATLDPTPFELNVKAAEAEVGRAKAVFAEKNTEYKRQKTLYEKNWVAKAALDQAVAARDSAQNEVSFAVSKLNLARRDLEKTELRVPFDAVIAAKFVEPFEEVSRGEKIFEIYSEGAMEVELQVPETSITSIYIGLPAEVAFPSEGMQTLPGRVSEVGSVASEANAFPVDIALIDPPSTVLPGMSAEVLLLLGEAEASASYLVPVSAIVPGDGPGQGFIFVYDAATSTVQKTHVAGRGVRDNSVVITAGISPGDIIAVAGVSFLRNGQKVKLLSK
ncbi:MAG: efflux RND transporter periplasmic adaptor subunit [Planctomycetota bacterium]|jgi:RND family efflux transporter MFP subunit